MTEAADKTNESRPALPVARAASPPEGYEVMDLHDPFEAHVAPLYKKSERPSDRRIAAFRVDDRHVDANGRLHEGMMMAFADAVLGGVAWAVSGERPCVTLSMQTNLMRPVTEGELVIGEAYCARRTRTVVFVNGDFTVEGKLVAQVTSLWKVLGAK